ncbi:uncharacterized protein LOC141703911 [Apium graveolens]|uniref:DUF4220 domain-containing protein n=1 Tax=Apium graveolens TaxID=4045 RepID=A0A6L5B847_APIGR|nr:hypothetical protein AG4045_011369 [Apium graveolens]
MGKLNEFGRELRYIFNQWELGICVLLSLFLQILLILAGPLRRTVSHKGLHILLWAAYLLADTTAIFAVGLISSKQFLYLNHYFNAPTNNILHTFWAPFLLAHLGGPDPITALALEDNELWLRHLFSFFTQFIAVAYVLYQSLTPNKLLAPSLLMFLCGIIKYVERTYALYCASANTFRDSVLKSKLFYSDYEKLTQYVVKEDAKPPEGFDPDEEYIKTNVRETADLTPLEVVQYGFFHFTHFKGLFADLIFSFIKRNQSRNFFIARSSNAAFGVVEVELNYLYDVLFTKLPVVYHLVGLGCRSVSIGAIVTSLVLFHHVDKKQFEPQGFEVGITYTLLIGGIVLEVIAFMMLVFSEWTVVKLDPFPDIFSHKRSLLSTLSDTILSAKIIRGKIICWLLNIGGSDSRRWAESISGFNFIHYCLHRRSNAKEKIYDHLGITGFVDEIVYVKQYPLPSYLKDFIFEELKMKAEMASDLDTAKKICSAKGEWVLGIAGYSSLDFFPYVANVDYDESLLLWHIATECCFNDKEDEEFQREQNYQSEHLGHRRIAKLISDYMIYLLVMKPGMMSGVSRIGLLRFRHTCATANQFFKKQLPKVGELQGIACETLIQLISTNKKPRSRSILFEAARLAKELQKIESIERWEIMSKVWVELLSYGASHIKINAHAQQLSKGGQLITVVWLLMTHLGLGDYFQGPVIHGPWLPTGFL